MKKYLQSQQKLCKLLFSEAESVDPRIRNLSPGVIIRLLRTYLYMTQKELAKRVGVPQSTISRIESETLDPNVKTFQKILGGLNCELTYLPTPKSPLEAFLKERVRRIAMKRVDYLKSTMALEKQLPEEDILEDLIRQEEERILREGASNLWDDQ